MSQENVEIVERAIAAVNDRDIDSYLACCTEDIQLQTPVSPIEGIYKGAEGIKRYFADLRDAGRDFRVTIDRLETVGVAQAGTIHLEPVTTWISQAGYDAERDTPGSSADAVVWALSELLLTRRGRARVRTLG